LLLKLGEATGRYRAAWRLIDFVLPQAEASGPMAGDAASEPTLAHPLFSFRLNRKKLREVRRREGRYLLRTNLCGRDPEDLWQFYIELTEVEAAFKNLKDGRYPDAGCPFPNHRRPHLDLEPLVPATPG